MELVVKRTLVLLFLVAAFLVVGLATTSAGSFGLGQAAYAGEDGCEDDDSCEEGGSGSDTGGTPSGGVSTGGGGTAESGSDASALPLALGGLGALAGGSLLLRRFARHNG